MTVSSKKVFAVIGLLVIISIGFFVVSQFFMLRKAHSTFDNYYAFRGCTKLLDQTAAYGDCETTSGDVIKIVEFRGAWYLDGDLPMCWSNFCF